MASTEIQGIYQGDIVVRTAIIRAMDLVRDTPDLLDSVFESLVEDELTNDVYGQKQVALARHWFMNTQIPVLMNFRASEEAIPCVTIALQESQEADQTHGDVHYIPQEKSKADWPIVAGPFNPVAYSATSGIMILPQSVMSNLTVAAGMLVVTRDGHEYPVMQNLGDDEISLKPYTTDDFTGAVIKWDGDQQSTTIESVTFKEVYQLGIHVLGEPSYLLYLHSIIQFMLLKYKQDLLETRGYERSSIASTDFRRNQEFENELVYSRYITLTGYARHYWPKQTTGLIASVDTQVDIDTDLVFSAPISTNVLASEPMVETPSPPATNDAGRPLTDDDPWGVIPQE